VGAPCVAFLSYRGPLWPEWYIRIVLYCSCSVRRVSPGGPRCRLVRFLAPPVWYTYRNILPVVCCAVFFNSLCCALVAFIYLVLGDFCVDSPSVFQVCCVFGRRYVAKFLQLFLRTLHFRAPRVLSVVFSVDVPVARFGSCFCKPCPCFSSLLTFLSLSMAIVFANFASIFFSNVGTPASVLHV
jgi:hypothetical protein